MTVENRINHSMKLMAGIGKPSEVSLVLCAVFPQHVGGDEYYHFGR
jgi:hypothetical protein